MVAVNEPVKRRRTPCRLSAWDLGKLKATPGWRVHSRQWRLAKALERHVGSLTTLGSLGDLSGFSRRGMLKHLAAWRAADVLRVEMLKRGQHPMLLRVLKMDVAGVELQAREQMIADVLGAMREIGGAASPSRIASAAGWDRAAVRRLLILMDRDKMVYEVVSGRARTRLYTLPRQR